MGRRALHALCWFSLCIALLVAIAWFPGSFAGLYVESHQGMVVVQVSFPSTTAAPSRDYAVPGLQVSAFSMNHTSAPHRGYTVAARYLVRPRLLRRRARRVVARHTSTIAPGRRVRELRLRPARHARPMPRVWLVRRDGGGVRRRLRMVFLVLSTVVAVFVALLWWRSYGAVGDYGHHRHIIN